MAVSIDTTKTGLVNAALVADYAAQSSAQAVISTNAKVSSEAARDLSQTYAAAGATAAKYYDTIALGRAGVADGVTFGVKANGSDGLTRPTLYRRDSSTTQTEIVSQVKGSEFDSIANLVTTTTVGPTPVAVGSVSTDAKVYYWPGSLSSTDKFVDSLVIASDRSSTAKIIVASVSGGNLTLVSSTSKSVVAGVNTLSDLSISVPAGCVVGVSCVGNYYSLTTATMWSTTTSTPSNTTYSTSTGVLLQYSLSLTGVVANNAKAALLKSTSADGKIGAIYTLGWGSIAAGSSSAASTKTWIFGVPVSDASYLKTVTASFSASGTAVVAVLSKSGSTFSLLASKTIAVSSGINSLTVNIDVPAGAYLGLFVTGASIKYTNGTNTEGYTVYATSGLPGTGTAQTDSLTTLRFEMSFGLVSGTYAYAAKEAASASLTSADISGVKAMALADNTGVSDATALLTAALTNYDYPYLPAGKFSVTTLPKYGRGLHGPGKLYVSGQRYFIPKRPSDKALQWAFRNALASDIATGNVLTFVGDSISHYMSSTSGDTHYIDMLTSYANFGVAADKPLMTALVNSNTTYTPAFYGVTLSGSVSNGSAGPLRECLVLAAGASISFVGTYEQVDCFYSQTAGAGTLTFAFNGTPFKTVDCSGNTDLDHFSGPSLTGQTSSGTYTITASVASVTVTGLVRLGVLTAGRLRLRTSRAAHGGYTFANFNSAAVNSIVKQGTYAGGKCVPVLALGTNDSSSLTTSQVLTNAQAVISAFQLAGITRMYAIPLFREGYEDVRTSLRKLYADNGISVIGTDTVDWWGSSLLADGVVHPNDAGHDLIASMFIEGIAQ